MGFDNSKLAWKNASSFVFLLPILVFLEEPSLMYCCYFLLDFEKQLFPILSLIDSQVVLQNNPNKLLPMSMCQQAFLIILHTNHQWYFLIKVCISLRTWDKAIAWKQRNLRLQLATDANVMWDSMFCSMFWSVFLVTVFAAMNWHVSIPNTTLTAPSDALCMTTTLTLTLSQYIKSVVWAPHLDILMNVFGQFNFMLFTWISISWQYTNCCYFLLDFVIHHLSFAQPFIYFVVSGRSIIPNTSHVKE